jgi:hypothetical protein
MAELAISKDFLAAYARLQKPVQRAVDAAIGKFASHTHASLQMKKLQNACDSRIRTIRITDFWRGIVLALGGRDYVLFDVLPHDDANTYAANRLFSVNNVLGVLEVRDQVALEEAAKAPAAVIGLFDKVANADLLRLGVDAELLPVVRILTSDEHLESFRHVLPQTQYNVLTGLAAGMTVDEVFAEVAEAATAPVDPDDLLAAAKRTPERIAFVSGPVELAAILAHPFDAWRTFLHPAQRDIAYRETYTGPAYITGSAGTGKTVTGLHRAVFLAERLPDDGSQILLTTFTRVLAAALENQLKLLTSDKKVLDRIKVISVDRLAHEITATKRGGNKKISVAEEPLLRKLWETAASQGPTLFVRGAVAHYSATFLRREWEQVILAQRLSTLEEYCSATRRGAGESLRRAQREQVWQAVSTVVAELAKSRQLTYLQLADEAARIAESVGAQMFRHVVVDEGQDLHPAQWRLLRALVPAGPNDMFLLADPYQRIYDSQASLASLGIEVRGRSRRLTINYRTTHEILDWSVKVLSGATAMGLDDAEDSLSGYRSITRGKPPQLVAHKDRAAENEALIEQVGTWLDQGVEPHAIGVAARTNQRAAAIATALREAFIPVADDKATEPGVCVATMHRLKGLEFQCLAVAGLESGELPAPYAITAAAEDPVANRLDLQRERCLLFVAVTRARDVLYLSHSGQASPLLPS